MPVDLMLLAEGVADQPRKTRALEDLRTGSSLNKGLLSQFERPAAEPERPSPRPGKVWSPPPKPTAAEKPAAVETSPTSVATMPDFSALRDDCEEVERPKAPISSNPFLQNDAVKRSSLQELPAPVLKINVPTAVDETSPTPTIDTAKLPIRDKLRFASAKKLPTDVQLRRDAEVHLPGPDEDSVDASTQDAEKAVALRDALADINRRASLTAQPDARRAALAMARRESERQAAAPPVVMPESPRPSVPSAAAPTQHSTAWLLALASMPADSALRDVTPLERADPEDTEATERFARRADRAAEEADEKKAKAKPGMFRRLSSGLLGRRSSSSLSASTFASAESIS